MNGAAAIDLHAEVVGVDRWVFTRAPFNDSEREVGWFAEECVGDIAHPGFRCFTARRAADLVGFAYGLDRCPRPADRRLRRSQNDPFAATSPSPAGSPDPPADRPSTSRPAGPGSAPSKTPSFGSAPSRRLRDRPRGQRSSAEEPASTDHARQRSRGTTRAAENDCTARLPPSATLSSTHTRHANTKEISERWFEATCAPAGPGRRIRRAAPGTPRSTSDHDRGSRANARPETDDLRVPP